MIGRPSPEFDPASVTGVVFDFYGTLARATQWLSIDIVLAEHGYEFPDEVRRRWWFEHEHNGLDHAEHSSDRDTYIAWQRQRMLGMLAECDVHPGEYEVILDKLSSGSATRVIEAYSEVAEVLGRLRDRGLALAICSNWDWDLAEAVDEAGLRGAVDVTVSSAWAGARKPHPRIFEHTLSLLGIEPQGIVFVGDSWGPDVVGPRAAGMQPVYLLRDGHWPDASAPDDPTAETVCAVDLRGVVELLGHRDA